MKNISQAKLAELKLPIAPAERQRAFEQSALMVRKLVSVANRASQLAEQAFQSLLAGVFGDKGKVRAANA